MKNRGGITSAKGFFACGDHVGLKKKRKDLALVWSETPATFAGAFTTNVAKAAPVAWNQAILDAGGKVRAILINSGQANACTGEQGKLAAAEMANTTAAALGCDPAQVVLASTGIIGVQIPLKVAGAGIKKIAAQLRTDSFSAACAAEAIMTTDTCMKQFSLQVELGGTTVTLGAMAKGSGMIHPNMATMLSFIGTDAAISAPLLQKALSASVVKTYNMITVDGDTSTNDMVAVLANGMAGNAFIDEENDDYFKFCAALDAVNTHLSKKIAGDGEGATKLVAVTVYSAANEDDARKLARTVVGSSLVKTALFAGDPNWGRIAAALGNAGVEFDVEKLSIGFGSLHGWVDVMHLGESCALDLIAAATVLQAEEIEIQIGINAGFATATAWGCDLSYDYVRINGTYRNSVPTVEQQSYAEVG